MALDGGEWSTSSSGHYTSWYILKRRLGGPQRWFELLEKTTASCSGQVLNPRLSSL